MRWPGRVPASVRHRQGMRGEATSSRVAPSRPTESICAISRSFSKRFQNQEKASELAIEKFQNASEEERHHIFELARLRYNHVINGKVKACDSKLATFMPSSTKSRTHEKELIPIKSTNLSGIPCWSAACFTAKSAVSCVPVILIQALSVDQRCDKSTLSKHGARDMPEMQRSPRLTMLMSLTTFKRIHQARRVASSKCLSACLTKQSSTETKHRTLKRTVFGSHTSPHPRRDVVRTRRVVVGGAVVNPVPEMT